MSTFRHTWTSLLAWVPPPIQISLALVLLLLIVTKVAPRVIRWSGEFLHNFWTPLIEVLTYPEFLLTTMCRRGGGQLLPGTHAYDRGLGALAHGGTSLGHWARNRFTTMPRFPWKTALLVIALLAGCWYGAPKVPPGGARTLMGNVNTDTVQLKSWLTTGQWVPAASTALTCTTKPVPAKDAHRKRTKKRERKR